MSTIRKALTAAGFGLAGTLGGTMLDGRLTSAEILFAIGSGLVAGAATWTVRNR